MERIHWIGIGLSIFLLTACGKSPSSTTPKKADPVASSSASTASTLNPPRRANDLRAWRVFARSVDDDEAGSLRRNSLSYVVPPGEDRGATRQRAEEARALRNVLERREVSGNAVIVTGPDSSKAADVIRAALKDFPEGKARGLTIIFVGVPNAANGIRADVSRAGAELQVRAMRPAS